MHVGYAVNIDVAGLQVESTINSDKHYKDW